MTEGGELNADKNDEISVTAVSATHVDCTAPYSPTFRRGQQQPSSNVSK